MKKPDSCRKSADHRQTLRMIGIYLLAGGAWVMSARLLLFQRNIDLERLPLLHTLEGWVFLLLTAGLFYFLISHYLQGIRLREAKKIGDLVSDISVQKHLVETLDQAREHYRLLFEQMAQGVVYLDGDGQITAVNPAAERILGMPGADLLGRTSIDPEEKALRADGTPLPPQEQPLRVAFDSSREVRNTVLGLFNPKEGAHRWVSVDAFPQIEAEGSRPFQVLSTFIDITERCQAEEKVKSLAFYDSLTGLPNRRLLLDRLHQALAQARREGRLVGIAFFDLDNFKTINDSLGHAQGDVLLQEVAKRLQESVRSSDTFARLGGDEFVVIINNLSNVDVAAAIAKKFLEIFRQPFRLGEREVYTTASIGLAIYPQDAGNEEELLGRADAAMYQAKKQGRNLYQFFAPQMHDAAKRRLDLSNELHLALHRGELDLFYQEQVSLETGSIFAAEALLRWRHPERGLLHPADFLSLAEESGLIIPIGEWVLRTACRHGKSWQQMGLPLQRMTVNISERQLRHGGLVKSVSRILGETGFPATSLELEFREEALFADQVQAAEVLAALRQLGVGCTLDDFGTGLSAIGRLRGCPLNRIKIDHSLIQNIPSAVDAELIQGIIELAHRMRLEVVAEGVENEEQMLFLQDLDCDAAQGFHLNRPAAAEELTKLLARAPTWNTCKFSTSP